MTNAVPSLRRFWFVFEKTEVSIAGHRFGVTAESQPSALALLERDVFDGVLPELASVRVDVDISSLDASHVRPNMGDPTVRGIWFPLGYSATRYSATS